MITFSVLLVDVELDWAVQQPIPADILWTFKFVVDDDSIRMKQEGMPAIFLKWSFAKAVIWSLGQSLWSCHKPWLWTVDRFHWWGWSWMLSCGDMTSGCAHLWNSGSNLSNGRQVPLWNECWNCSGLPECGFRNRTGSNGNSGRGSCWCSEAQNGQQPIKNCCRFIVIGCQTYFVGDLPYYSLHVSDCFYAPQGNPKRTKRTYLPQSAL